MHGCGAITLLSKLRHNLSNMDDWTLVPAYVVNRPLDVLAKNKVAAALYEGLEHSDNLLRLALLNPASREFYLDWETDTSSKVAHLRATAGTDGDEPFLLEQIEELSRGSEDFRRMWARHEVRGRTRAPVRFHHREVGDMITDMEVFSVDSAPRSEADRLPGRAGQPVAARPGPADRARRLVQRTARLTLTCSPAGSAACTAAAARAPRPPWRRAR
jgi:hypothetical protein